MGSWLLDCRDRLSTSPESLQRDAVTRGEWQRWRDANSPWVPTFQPSIASSSAVVHGGESVSPGRASLVTTRMALLHGLVWDGVIGTC